MASIVHSTIRDEVVNHILFKYGGKTHYVSAILSALNKLLIDTYEKYEFPMGINITDGSWSLVDNFQYNLSKINEKESRRKTSGVYYTDHDVTDFMVLNAYNHYITPSLCSVLDTKTIDKNFKKLDSQTKERILAATVFDPTCGAGEFLISALALKLKLFENHENVICKLLDLIGTIKGNDIDETSTDISKIRLFFLLIDSFAQELDVNSIAKVIAGNFHNVDTVDYRVAVFTHYGEI